MIYPLSTTYAIEALCYLATLPRGNTVKAREMAARLDIPEQYLGKVLSQLVRKSFVRSSKGPTGGYSLAVDPGSVSLHRIMAGMDSLSALEDQCVMGLKECTSEAPCAFHEDWQKFKSIVLERARNLTLADLAAIVAEKLRLGSLRH